KDVFGVGIFAGSECWGLVVQGNRFVGDTDALRVSQRPFRMLAGYVLTPTALVRAGGHLVPVGTVPAGTLVRSLLQEPEFRGNQFSDLTVAVLVYANTGIVTCTANTVRECYAGFWLLSQNSLAIASGLDRVMVAKNFLTVAERLHSSFLAVLLDP